MKSFLKQVLAILVALIIFGIGSCAVISYRVRSAFREVEAQRQAEEDAEKQRIKQFNEDFLEQHNEMLNRPLPLPPGKR